MRWTTIQCFTPFDYLFSIIYLTLFFTIYLDGFRKEKCTCQTGNYVYPLVTYKDIDKTMLNLSNSNHYYKINPH